MYRRAKIMSAELTQASQAQRENIISSFLAWQDVKPTSRRAYRIGLNNFLNWIQAQGLEQPTRADIIRYKEYLEATYCASTARLYLQTCKALYTWLEQTAGADNIARKIRPPKKAEGFRKEALTPQQAKNLLASMPTDTTEEALRNKAIITILITTGLRLIELQRADMADLLISGGEAILLIQGKGRDEKDGRALITGTALTNLKTYLETRGDVPGEAPLFTSTSNRNKGERMTTRALSGIAKRALQESGLDSNLYTAHSLRHTAATLAVEAGASPLEVKAMCRHSDINTTLIYLHNVDRIGNAPERKILDVIANA